MHIRPPLNGALGLEFGVTVTRPSRRIFAVANEEACRFVCGGLQIKRRKPAERRRSVRAVCVVGRGDTLNSFDRTAALGQGEQNYRNTFMNVRGKDSSASKSLLALRFALKHTEALMKTATAAHYLNLTCIDGQSGTHITAITVCSHKCMSVDRTLYVCHRCQCRW